MASNTEDMMLAFLDSIAHLAFERPDNTTQSSGGLSKFGSRPPLLTAKSHANVSIQEVTDTGDSNDEHKTNSLPAGGQAMVSANPQSALLTLPQEIHDIIFDFAYPRRPGIKLVTRRMWKERERDKRREYGPSYTMLPFPRQKVDSFLVSKKFFVNAARAYIDNQVFDEISMGDLHDEAVLKDLQHWRKSGYSGIAAAFVSSFECDWRGLEGCVVHLPKLKAITIKVSRWTFDSIFPRIPWEVELKDMDLSSVMDYANLEELRGLQQVHIIGAEYRYIKTETQRATWNENLRRLEAFLTKYLCRPKQNLNGPAARSNVSKTEGLYEGSRVTLESSVSQGHHKDATKESNKDKTMSSIDSGGNLELFQKLLSAPMLPCGGKRKLDTEPTSSPKEATSLHSSCAGLQNKSLLDGSPEESEPALTRGKKRKVLLQDQNAPYDGDHFKALLEKDRESVIEWIYGLRAAAADQHIHNGSAKHAMDVGPAERLFRLMVVTGMKRNWCEAFMDVSEWNLSKAFNRFKEVKMKLPAEAIQRGM